MTYRAGKKARRMYRHYERYGTAGMSKRQLRALARESDYGVNPRRSRRSRRSRRRNPLSCRMGKERMFHELKHHASRWRPQKQRVAIVLSTLRKCRGKRRRRNPGYDPLAKHAPARFWIKSDGDRYVVSSRRISYQDLGSGWYFVAQGIPEADVEDAITRNKRSVARAHANPVFMNPRSRRSSRARRNPKRDGSMTRGEKRLQKHAEWLREIAARGKKAEALLRGIRTVPAASHVAAAEHAANKLSETTIEKAMEGVPAAVAKVETVVEHAEAKFLRQQIADLTMLINSTTEEANALGEADESMAEELMQQVTKMSKQRKALKDKAQGLGIQMNPRRRTVLVGIHRYAKALHDLGRALRRR